MATQQAQIMLRNMGFKQSYITRALEEYEQHFGKNKIHLAAITEKILQLQRKDDCKMNVDHSRLRQPSQQTIQSSNSMSTGSPSPPPPSIADLTIPPPDTSNVLPIFRSSDDVLISNTSTYNPSELLAHGPLTVYFTVSKKYKLNFHIQCKDFNHSFKSPRVKRKKIYSRTSNIVSYYICIKSKHNAISIFMPEGTHQFEACIQRAMKAATFISYANSKIQVKINGTCSGSQHLNCLFIADATLANTLQDLKQGILEHINDRYDPLRFDIKTIHGFESKYNFNKTMILNVDHLMNGLYIDVEFVLKYYEHGIASRKITCPHMNKLNTDNANICPIYYTMMENDIYSDDYLMHLNEYTHLRNEFIEKPQCKDGDECEAFMRLAEGDYILSDLCHIKLYRHPPRARSIKLSENINALAMNKDRRKNVPLYVPTKDDNHHIHQISDVDNIYLFENEGGLASFLTEIVVNGYRHDLCLECGQMDDCKHSEYTVMKIVDEKINCRRHKTMEMPLHRAEMLALVLYTGLSINSLVR